MNYVALAVPVTLTANTEYYLASQETAGGDSFYSFNTAVITTSGASVLSAIYSSDGNVWSVPASGTRSFSYVPVSLVYCDAAGSSLAAPREAEVQMVDSPAVTRLALSAAVVENGYLVLPYVRSSEDIGVSIEASADGATWTSADDLIEETVTALDSGMEYVQARYLVPVSETSVRYLRLQAVFK
jgi:hypothetical protein